MSVVYGEMHPSKVKKELLKLNINKASGPDDVPALVLKMPAPDLATPLSRLFPICCRYILTKVTCQLQEGRQAQLQVHLPAFYLVKGDGEARQ